MDSDVSALMVRIRSRALGLYGAGKTLDRSFQATGTVVDNALDRISHILGQGPMTISNQIDALFGDNPQSTKSTLEGLHQWLSSDPYDSNKCSQELSNLCIRLMRYTDS